MKAGKETRMNKDLQKNKADALDAYKAAKAAYLENMNSKNWIAFCNAKTNCMRLGFRI